MKRTTKEKIDKSRLSVRLTEENTRMRIRAEEQNIHISKWVNRVLNAAFIEDGYGGKRDAASTAK